MNRKKNQPKVSPGLGKNVYNYCGRGISIMVYKDVEVNNKRVTISDVAEKAGVLKQTVSRVINEHPDVADHRKVD